MAALRKGNPKDAPLGGFIEEWESVSRTRYLKCWPRLTYLQVMWWDYQWIDNSPNNPRNPN